MIKVHLVFTVKFHGRHKARLVAEGHLTPEPIENIYAGIVSLRNHRLVIFLHKLHMGSLTLEMHTWQDLLMKSST